MHNVERLEVGMPTSIDKGMFPGDLEAGQEYVRPSNSDGWVLFAGDPSEELPIVVRVDSILGDVCHCTVVRKLDRSE